MRVGSVGLSKMLASRGTTTRRVAVACVLVLTHVASRV